MAMDEYDKRTARALKDFNKPKTKTYKGVVYYKIESVPLAYIRARKNQLEGEKRRGLIKNYRIEVCEGVGHVYVA
jgi:hypothetical protein